eukprot:COSAG01_NODE_3124_length_6550_cov_213.272981_1_plen_70_part_00
MSLVVVLRGEGVTACSVCVRLGGDVEYFGAANLVREQRLSLHTAQPSQQPARGLCRSTPPTARTACRHT